MNIGNYVLRVWPLFWAIVFIVSTWLSLRSKNEWVRSVAGMVSGASGVWLFAFVGTD